MILIVLVSISLVVSVVTCLAVIIIFDMLRIYHDVYGDYLERSIDNERSDN
jgi:hypothetical protein